MQLSRLASKVTSTMKPSLISKSLPCVFVALRVSMNQWPLLALLVTSLINPPSSSPAGARIPAFPEATCPPLLVFWKSMAHDS